MAPSKSSGKGPSKSRRAQGTAGGGKGKRAGTKTKAAARSGAKAKRGTQSKADVRPWATWTLLMILGVGALRLVVNALGMVPVHFDEGQYWAYGQEIAFGHFSKPPLVGWVILATTSLGGDTTFWLRTGAVLAHALVALGTFVVGRRLFDGQTGFWAAAGYTAAPGVSVSAMIMSTDPVMMAAWVLALYAWIRAMDGARFWWLVMGAALGAGFLAKYTILAFAVGAMGYGLFAPRGRDWVGVGLAAGAALAVAAPNLIWQATHDFATVTHVAEDAAPGGSLFNIGKMAEFLGAQLGVIGPVWFLAIMAGLLTRSWWNDWRMRLLGWQTFGLLLPIIALAFVTRAQPNWAAPAYVGGAIFAARLLLIHRWYGALKFQAAIGAIAALAVYAAAFAYHSTPLSLPRSPDPFKKMRIGTPFCERALAAMGEEGAEVLLSDDRRRLSECMFMGSLTFQDIAVWNPDPWPENHHEMVASLHPGDQRVMILAVMTPEAGAYIAERFEEAREIETGTVQTHSARAFGFSIWAVRGFKDY